MHTLYFRPRRTRNTTTTNNKQSDNSNYQAPKNSGCHLWSKAHLQRTHQKRSNNCKQIHKYPQVPNIYDLGQTKGNTNSHLQCNNQTNPWVCQHSLVTHNSRNQYAKTTNNTEHSSSHCHRLHSRHKRKPLTPGNINTTTKNPLSATCLKPQTKISLNQSPSK